MSDVLCIAAFAGFGLLSWGLLRLAENLMGANS